MAVTSMSLSSRGFNARVGPRSNKIETARNPRETLLRLLKYFSTYKLSLVLIFILVLISVASTISGPYLIGFSIDQTINKGNLNGLFQVAILMLVFFIVGWISDSISGIMTAEISQKVLKSIRKDLFEHLQTLSIRFFDRNPHGELMSRLTNDVDAINQAVSQNITQLFSNVLTMTGVLIAMLLLNFWLTLACMIAIPLMMILVAKVTKFTRKSFRSLQNQIGSLNGIMEENISGLREVKIFRRNKTAMTVFESQNQKVCEAGIQAQTFALLMMPLMTILSNLNIALVAGIGGWMAISNLATIGQIASFISYTRTFTHPLRQIANLFNTIQAALAGAERIFDIIDQEPDLIDFTDSKEVNRFHGEVLFEDVKFGYDRERTIIKDLSLHANPGEMIALVGPTGAGKTTIVNLLTRFYDIDSGSIKIDGIEINRIKQTNLRQQLGLVLQDAFLFSDSVLQNIRYGRLDANDEECIQAAKLANADQFIRRLPMGYETELKERGSNLSQGQRQLITIARAILANPSILILDEATSSVDTRTELHIQEAFLNLMKGRTSFVIAHRLSTIRKANQVLVINNGEIIEKGTHSELLAQKGFYFNLFMSQFKGTIQLPPDNSVAS
jgi:ATP-binding cassette subfamily B protein